MASLTLLINHKNVPHCRMGLSNTPTTPLQRGNPPPDNEPPVGRWWRPVIRKDRIQVVELHLARQRSGQVEPAQSDQSAGRVTPKYQYV